MKRTITILPLLFVCFTIFFTASSFLVGCSAGTIALLVSTHPDDPNTETSKTQSSDTRLEQTKLRSSYRKLTVNDVQSMKFIKIRKRKEWGFYGYSTISHNYVLKRINNDKVVIDYATDLMWHQSGSTYGVNWEKAKRWVRLLNRRGYAGYHDWRMPTIEEAASLLELSKRNNNDRFIDPVFHMTQGWIWTGDIYYRSNAAWRVDYFAGLVDWDVYSYDFYFVKPVRTMK